MSLVIIPITFKEANEFVRRYHRHHKPIINAHIFHTAVAEGDVVVGVALVGLPLARMLCDGFTLEVRRTCVLDGYKNANSKLYGACWRIARELGYRRLITYTLPEEGGVSLRGAGFTLVGEAGGGTWHRPNCGRPRVDLHPTQKKLRWEKITESAAPKAVPESEER